jgi:hypothetical protein
MTQYEAIMKHLRKHGSATVRDLLKYTNYPSARIHEMTTQNTASEWIKARMIKRPPDIRDVWTLRIDRIWTTRNGKKVRLYKLVRVK